MKFSVLLPVYWKDKPEYLEKAICSILSQTMPPDEVVIVKDGPLSAGLDSLIEKFVQNRSGLFRILALEKNMGLGEALRQGLDCCSNSIVARMDSDDYSIPERFEKQIEALTADPELDLVGSYIAEFEGSIENIKSIRNVPLSINEIKSYAKHRNPINHVTVMFKKSAVLKAGGYKSLHGFEDYYLWMRMLAEGCKMLNLPLELVLVRVDNMFTRRGGLDYVKSERKLQREFLKSGYINWSEYIFNIVVRQVTRIVPNRTRKFVYMKLLRKKYREGLKEMSMVNNACRGQQL